MQHAIKAYILEKNLRLRKDRPPVLIADIMRREKNEMPESLDLTIPANQEEFDKMRNTCTKFVSKQCKRCKIN